ncbi:D-arabinono-1,4-lactone oxidase [Glycomyces arizonensis]|uniref:D-arabinono-1,4-lactone oxidase n=1 Tax=Glycomyces arizonensis TaxID=256035 RepID=UPI0003FB0AB8|nr:D-arabinono-1,4-lactone oxidase [Glycomyces arizonensis]
MPGYGSPASPTGSSAPGGPGDAPLTNWAGNVAFAPERFEPASSIEAAREIVAAAPRLRVLGSGHSFNAIADSSAVLLSLSGIEPEVTIDAEAREVRASGWITYAALGRAVHEAGFALHNFASLPHISVAGSIATGTHGSGDGSGNLATAVAALEFIGADGEVRTLRRGEPDFAGAVVHLGALGVITAVTLDLLPAFEMRQYVYDGLSFDAAVAHFDELTSSAYSTSMFTPWGADPSFQFWTKQRVADQTQPFPASQRFGAPLADGPRHPIPGVDPAACTEQQGRTGPAHERLPHFRPEFTPSAGEELQSEYLVDRADAPAALEALRAVSERLAPVVQISEVRTMAADDLWLSPAYGRDTVGLHFTWVRDYASVRPVMGVVEEVLAPFAPRPHWGKLFTIPIPEIRSQYPRMGDFEKLRDRTDPEGKFVNDFCAELLGGSARLRVVSAYPTVRGRGHSRGHSGGS